MSVPANIAQGSKRRTNQDFARLLNISEGSLSETDDLLLCRNALGDRSAAALDPLAQGVDEISRMLYTLRRKVEREP